MRDAVRACIAGAVALTLAGGCGGSDGAGSGTVTSSRTAGPGTDVDADITRLVRVRGARLNAAAARLLGDSARLGDADAVRAVAPARAAIAARIRGEATQDTGTLARLASSARATSNVVPAAGQAFVAFERCGRLGMAFFGDPAPDPGGTELRAADRACDSARAAYAAARAELRRAP